MLAAKMRFKKRPIAWLVVDYILIYTSFVDIPFSLSPFMSCYILIETNKGSSDFVICLLDTKKIHTRDSMGFVVFLYYCSSSALILLSTFCTEIRLKHKNDGQGAGRRRCRF